MMKKTVFARIFVIVLVACLVLGIVASAVYPLFG